MNIIFVCKANIGRSQMGEAIFRQKAPTKFVVSSAGTNVALDKEENMEGQPLMDKSGAEDVLLALRELGIEAGEAKRNQLTEEMYQAADVVVMMVESETWPDYVSPGDIKVRHWPISDPAKVGIERTRELRDQIAGLVEGLLGELKGANYLA